MQYVFTLETKVRKWLNISSYDGLAFMIASYPTHPIILEYSNFFSSSHLSKKLVLLYQLSRWFLTFYLPYCTEFNILFLVFAATSHFSETFLYCGVHHHGVCPSALCTVHSIEQSSLSFTVINAMHWMSWNQLHRMMIKL